MDDENLFPPRSKIFQQALVLFQDNTLNRWQKAASDHVNGRELCQLNLQVLWPPTMLPPTLRPHRPPMFKIRSLPRRPLPLFDTAASIRGVLRRKQAPTSRRLDKFKKRRLEIVTGELNAQFDRLFSRSRSTSSDATNKDEIEELSSKTSQMNITTLE